MGADGSDVRLVSTGRGRTTCAYFFAGRRAAPLRLDAPRGRRTVRPPPTARSGYVWPLYDYDIYTCAADGSDLRRLDQLPRLRRRGHDRARRADRLHVDARRRPRPLRRWTPTAAACGGSPTSPATTAAPFFSWDGRDIVWRGWHPTDPDERAEYRALLGQGLVRPSRAELFVMAADGTGARQVTSNGAANWAPFLHPDGERIVFSSNLHDPGRFDFALYLIRRDGRGLERAHLRGVVRAFPMFSPDGRRLVFCSSRGAPQPREFNVFVADWVD